MNYNQNCHICFCLTRDWFLVSWRSSSQYLYSTAAISVVISPSSWALIMQIHCASVLSYLMVSASQKKIWSQCVFHCLGIKKNTKYPEIITYFISSARQNFLIFTNETCQRCFAPEIAKIFFQSSYFWKFDNTSEKFLIARPGGPVFK